jgi:hypothetical protein
VVAQPPSTATDTPSAVINDTPAPVDTTTATDNSTSSGQLDYNAYWTEVQTLQQEQQDGVTITPPQTQDYNDYWAQVQVQQQALQDVATTNTSVDNSTSSDQLDYNTY